MGMDVYGKKPDSEEGEYFRNSVWNWRPLAAYVQEVAPEICAACTHWDTNDGDGLNASASMKLAVKLAAEISSGRTRAYEMRYKSDNEALPDEPCHICAGTGTRPPIPQCGVGDPKNGGLKCNGCDGTGYVRPWQTHYPFDEDNVRDFVTFLAHCGGFEIN
jgi:hypothetical protein